MIPAPFDYVRPGTVDEAVAALQQAGEDAKILAGGQSLIPVLRLRLAAPSMLIDLGGIPELRRIRADGDRIAIGAMAPHHEVMRDELVKEHVGLLAQALRPARVDLGDLANDVRGMIDVHREWPQTCETCRNGL